MTQQADSRKSVPNTMAFDTPLSPATVDKNIEGILQGPHSTDNTGQSESDPSDKGRELTKPRARKKKAQSTPVLKVAQGPRLITVRAEEHIPFHPATEAYPIYERDSTIIRESLREDGQANPITLLEELGQRWIIDGRTRYREGAKLGMALLAIVLTHDQILDVDAWVAAKFRASAKSRRMTPSQLALLAADLVHKFEKKAEARKRAGIQALPGESGRSYEKAAKEVGASSSATRLAQDVIKYPFLREAVSNGRIPISVGAKIAGLADDQKRKEALAAALKKDRALLDRLLERDAKATDSLGQTIPPKLEEVFCIAQQLNNFADQFDAAAKTFEEIERSDNATVAGDISIKHLRDLADRIRKIVPYCVCSACEADGDQCPWCEQRGWLSQKRYAQWKHASRMCRA